MDRMDMPVNIVWFWNDVFSPLFSYSYISIILILQKSPKMKFDYAEKKSTKLSSMPHGLFSFNFDSVSFNTLNCSSFVSWRVSMLKKRTIISSIKSDTVWLVYRRSSLLLNLPIHVEEITYCTIHAKWNNKTNTNRNNFEFRSFVFKNLKQ